ncbi:MAG TPA: hypothetical protein VMD99_15045 [Terriglobales bacterium]|nr:hypothetical protein [Terriglobales bacterium]
MKLHRLRIEIVRVSAASACSLALAIGALGTATAAGLEPPQARQAAAETYEGVVTCSHCGARHSAKLGQTAADCTRMCVHAGASFALVDGDKMYLLAGDLNLLKKMAGERVRITGVASGNTIRVATVSAADGSRE